MKIPSSTGICGFRKNEAKLTENHYEISQNASTKLYQNQRANL
jgi:hypothetical protein